MYIDAEMKYEDASLVFSLTGGIEGAKIKLTDWCTLTRIKLRVEIKLKPLEFFAKIEATFVVPAPTYKGTNDDCIPRPHGGYCLPNPKKYKSPCVNHKQNLGVVHAPYVPMCCMG